MTLEELRAAINEIDNEIVRLLNLRAEKAILIGMEKIKERAPVYDPLREDEVVARVQKLCRGPLSGRALADIYRRIMAACLEVQQKDRDLSR